MFVKRFFNSHSLTNTIFPYTFFHNKYISETTVVIDKNWDWTNGKHISCKGMQIKHDDTAERSLTRTKRSTSGFVDQEVFVKGYYLTIGMWSPYSEVQCNFGRKPFMYQGMQLLTFFKMVRLQY